MIFLESIDTTEAERGFLALIPEGEENAVSMADLAGRAGTDDRTVRKTVFDLRVRGHIIAGDRSGYYRPATTSQIKSYYHLALRRARSSLAIVNAMKKRLRAAGILPDETAR